MTQEQQVLQGHTDTVWCVSWAKTGALASCGSDKSVRIWLPTNANAITNEKDFIPQYECVAILDDSHMKAIRSCAWSPDSKYLATASFDGSVGIWKVADYSQEWEMVAVLEGHENEVKGVSWSPSGQFVATCGRDKTVWIWESLEGNEFECVDVKQGHTQDVKFVRWHPTHDILVSGGYDDSIKIWVEDGQDWVCSQSLQGPITGHKSTVWAASFNQDGTQLISCSEDQVLKLWKFEIQGTANVKCILQGTFEEQHERAIYSVDWSTNGFIATGCGDNHVRIFKVILNTMQDSENGANTSKNQYKLEQISIINNAHDALDVNCVAWSPKDPKLLASAGDNGSVRLYKFNDLN